MSVSWASSEPWFCLGMRDELGEKQRRLSPKERRQKKRRWLGQVENAESGDALSLVFDQLVEVEIEDVAKGSQEKEIAADLLLEHFDAMLAKGPFYVGGHMLFHFPVADIGGDLLAGGIDLDTATRGDGFDDRPVHAGGGLLKLGDDVEDAAVADQALGDGLLERCVGACSV